MAKIIDSFYLQGSGNYYLVELEAHSFELDDMGTTKRIRFVVQFECWINPDGSWGDSGYNPHFFESLEKAQEFFDSIR